MRRQSFVVFSRVASLSRPLQKAGSKSLSRMGGTTLRGCFMVRGFNHGRTETATSKLFESERRVHLESSPKHKLAWGAAFTPLPRPQAHRSIGLSDDVRKLKRPEGRAPGELSRCTRNAREVFCFLTLAINFRCRNLG